MYLFPIFGMFENKPFIYQVNLSLSYLREENEFNENQSSMTEGY